MKFTLVFCGLFSTVVLSAQSLTFKASEQTFKGANHEILNCLDGNYITVSYPDPHDRYPVLISRFDRDAVEKYTRSLKELKREYYRAALYEGDHLSLFYANKDGLVNRYDIDGNTGALTGTPTALFELQAKEENATFLSGSSADNNFHYLVAKGRHKKEKGEILEGVVLDRQMQKIVTFSFVTPQKRADFHHLDVVQSNNGTLSLIYDVELPVKGKDNYRPFLYTIVQVDLKGKVTALPLKNLPAGDWRNVSWTADGDVLQFAGFLSREPKAGFSDIESGSVNVADKKLSLKTTRLVNITPSSPEYLANLGKSGLPLDAALIKTVRLSDGSKALLLESNPSPTFYQSHYATPHGTPGAASFTIMTFYRGPLYLLKVDRNNTPVWLDLISKNQMERDAEICSGATCTCDDKGNVYVFFLDNKVNLQPNASYCRISMPSDKSSNELFCVTVAPDGKMKKQAVQQKEEDHKFRMMPEISCANKNNEICLVAIKLGGFNLMPTQIFTHANYRFSKVEIK